MRVGLKRFLSAGLATAFAVMAGTAGAVSAPASETTFDPPATFQELALLDDKWSDVDYLARKSFPSKDLKAFAAEIGVDCETPAKEARGRLENGAHVSLYHFFLSGPCNKGGMIKTAEYYRGLFMFRQENYGKAVEFLEASIKHGTPKPKAHLYLGRSYWRLSKGKEAVTALEKLLKLEDVDEAYKSQAKQDIALVKASLEGEESAKDIPKTVGEVKIKKKASEITLQSYPKQGKNKRLGDHKGKAVVLHFWATWCLPCIKEFPELMEFRKRNKDKGLALVTSSQDYKWSPIRKFFKKNGYPGDLPVYYDQGGRLLEQLTNTIALPTTLVFDGKGNFVKARVGRLDWSGGEMIELIEGLLNEGPEG